MSSPPSSESQDHPKLNGHINTPSKPKLQATDHTQPVAQTTVTQDVLLFLVAFRLLNALAVRTFFQPDEYFQSLEPAWYLAFGAGSGAWITWEWVNHLRSAFHPAIFGVLYYCLDRVATVLDLPLETRAELLVAGPKVLQALFAATGDYYTWKLAEQVYGKASARAWTALALTVVSPWQWFCSIRTLSNSLETTLTIIALYNWPWHWSLVTKETKFQVDTHGLRIRDAEDPGQADVDELTRLCRALLLAAFASILRPTNVLIWATLIATTFVRDDQKHWLAHMPWLGTPVLLQFSAWSIVPTYTELLTLAVESALCGGIVLAISALIDRLFYGLWTFPPYHFLYFNLVQSLAVFYGNNDWHYYLSQGYLLLLTTALPFALAGLYQIIWASSRFRSLKAVSQSTLRSLAAMSLLVPAALSLLSHKEVRFIYPLIPALHIIAAQPIHDLFGSAVLEAYTHPKLKSSNLTFRRILLGITLILNTTIALYTTLSHNSGLISITSHLRHEFLRHHLPSYPHQNMTVAFLMPCHSTPWRSHLQFPSTVNRTGISAWALTCEPPLHLSRTEKAAYVDEADEFYVNPSLWLRRNMVRGPPLAPPERARIQDLAGDRTNDHHAPGPRLTYPGSKKREWPDYLVFFEELENRVLRTSLRGSGYAECKQPLGRVWNSAWHDDWRRRGDIITYCLDRRRQKTREEVMLREEVQKVRAERKSRTTHSLYDFLRPVDELRRDASNDNGNGKKLLGGGLGPWGVGSHASSSPSSSLSGDPKADKKHQQQTPFTARRPNDVKTAKSSSWRSWWSSSPSPSLSATDKTWQWTKWRPSLPWFQQKKEQEKKKEGLWERLVGSDRNLDDTWT